jgi:hypothetical protein
MDNNDDLSDHPVSMDDSDGNINSSGVGRPYALSIAVADTSEDPVPLNRQSQQQQQQPSVASARRAPSSSQASHQALLRQQAHAPAIIPSGRTPSSSSGVSMSIPNAYSHPRLEDFRISGLPSYQFPEHAISDPSTATTPTSTSGWCVVETNGGIPPSARSLHAAALLNGNLYIFGGYDGVSRVNTFHAYSFAEKRWSPVLPSAASANPPPPRDRHVAVAFGNSFFVHGGFDGTSRKLSATVMCL